MNCVGPWLVRQVRNFDRVQIHELHFTFSGLNDEQVKFPTSRWENWQIANNPYFDASGLCTKHLTQNLLELITTQQKITPS